MSIQVNILALCLLALFFPKAMRAAFRTLLSDTVVTLIFLATAAAAFFLAALSILLTPFRVLWAFRSGL